MANRKTNRSGTVKPIVDFVRAQKRNQWEKLKQYIRTGVFPKGLDWSTIKGFSKQAFRHKEELNRRRKKPYSGFFSKEEKKEIEVQLNDAVKLIYPNLSPEKKSIKVKNLLRGVEPILWIHVEEALKEMESEDFMRTGRMYLTSLDPRNKNKGNGTFKVDSILGYPVHPFTSVLSGNWLTTKYSKTTPFHEAIHLLLPSASEGTVLLVDYYYSLKRGIMTPQYLRRTTAEMNEVSEAKNLAIRLYSLGQKEGRKIAEEELRNVLSNNLHEF